MNKSLPLNTPQKRSLPSFSTFEDCFLKELSPLAPTLLNSSNGKGTKLQLLQSPLPANRDLFSQLLGTQIKKGHDNNLGNLEIMEQQAYDDIDEIDFREYFSDQEQEMSSDNDDEEDDNGIKKRKRKSTNQIKILKQQLDVESNWSKQKIAEMSEITGLSQSQVYKWWWDQKKKNMKNESIHSRMMKRKVIKKYFSKRSNEDQNEGHNKLNSYGYQIDEQIQTKLKNTIDIEQVPETERKVNKRLVFG